MDKAFRRNLGPDVDLLYTDTDSAMLKQKKNVSLDFNFGNGYRQWKSELPAGAEMISYCALGPKSYSYNYALNGCEHSTIKCKGFSLKKDNKISHDDMLKMVQKRKEGRVTKRTIPQFAIRIEKKSRKMYNTYFFKTLSSDILKKRVLLAKEARTLPFGYSQSML